MRGFASFVENLKKYQILLLVSGILILGFVLRLLHLGANQLALDEPFSVFHAQMSFREIISNLKGLNNPPLNEIVLHFWIKIFGISATMVRIPSLIFGVLNCYLVFVLARNFLNLKVALLALFIITFSNYQLFFSHEARVYSLFALLTTWAFYLFLKMIQSEGKTWDYIFLYLCYSLLIFAHYFGAVIILMQISFLFILKGDKRKTIVRFILVLAGLLLTYSFYLPEIFSRFKDSAQNGTWLQAVENLGNLHDLMYYFANSNKVVYLLFIILIWGATWKYFFEAKIYKPLKWGIVFGIIPVFFLTSYSIFFKIPFFWKLTSAWPFIFFFSGTILFIYAVYLFLERKRKAVQLVIFGWFLVPFLVFFAVSFFMPVFLDRYLIFIMPAFYLTLAIALYYLVPLRFFWLGSCILILGMLLSFNINESNNRDVRSLVNKTGELKAEGSKVFICPDQFKHTFSYHYNKEIFTDFENFDARLETDSIFLIYNSYDLDELLSADDSIVIYVDAHGRFLFPENGIIERLTAIYGEGEKHEFQDSMFVYQFRNEKVLREE